MKKFAKMAGVFAVTLTVLFFLQVLINCIPRNRVEANLQKSIEEVKQTENSNNRYRPVDGLYMMTDDRLGDFAWLQIIYNIDSNHPVQSTIDMMRYTNLEKYHEELERQMTEGLGPNDSYGRYWHGMTGILRILLLFLSLTQIKIFFAIVLAVVWGAAIVIWSKKNLQSGLLLLLSALLSSSFFCVLSVEYVPVFLLTAVFLIILPKVSQKDQGVLFLLFGLLTAYFDFLTTETLVFLIPMLMLLSVEKKTWKDIFVLFVDFGVGYIGAFLAKFVLYFGFGSGQSFLSTMTNKFFGTKTATYQYMGQSAVLKNIRNLIPLKMVTPVTIFGIAIGIVLFVLLFLGTFHSKTTNWKKIAQYSVLGLLPIFRYIVLNGHSYNHSDFTYRALFGTILAILLICAEVSKKEKIAEK